MTVTRLVSAANEVTIGGFWREHAEGELRTRRDHEILKFLSPCWGKEFMAEMFGTKATIFGHQPVLGFISGLPQILLQHGPSVHV